MNTSARCFSALALFLCLTATTALAASPAREALENSINTVLQTIREPAYANPATREPLKQKIEAELRTSFDFDEFSSRTVGPRWKEFSAEQKQCFADAFANLLMRTYVDKVDGYNGEQVAFTGERANSKGDRVEIQTSIALKDGRKIPVFYRMLPKNGTWRVYDVVVENISLVMNYRTQFQELLASGTPDSLIERVQAKAVETRGSK